MGEVLGVEICDDTEELWAYVRYARPQDAEDAVRSFDGIEFQCEFTEMSLHVWEDSLQPDLD